MLEKDKLLHFIVCETIVIVVSIIGLFVGLGAWSFPVAFFVSMIAGIGKELRDRKTTGFDKVDLAADFFGAFAGLVFSSLFGIGIAP